MGKSTGISDKEKSDTEFRAYMDTRRQEGEKLQKELVAKLKVECDRFYHENQFNHSLYLGNQYQEFQNTSKWSLDNVTKIIEAVSQILLGKNKGAKDVQSKDQTVLEAIGEGAAALAANQQLIISRVFDAVTSILGTFDVVSEARRVAKQEHFPILAGLHLFLSASNETYKSQTFFTNEYINQLNICYEVHFSDQEAAQAGRIDSATQYFDQIVVFNKRLKKMNAELAASETLEEFEKLEKFIAKFEEQRDAAQTQLDSINKARKSLKWMTMRNANANANANAIASRLESAMPAYDTADVTQLHLQAGSWPDAPPLQN